MDFITQNLTIIIIIAVVLGMAVIGYIAEKTDFGKKKKSASDVVPTPVARPAVEPFVAMPMEQPKPEAKVVTNVSDGFTMTTEEIMGESYPMETSEEQPEIIEEATMSSIEDNSVAELSVDENVDETIVANPVEEVVAEEASLPELNEEVSNVEEIKEEASLPELNEEVSNVEEIKEEQMPLPELGEEVEPELDEDSVWKF